MQQQKQFKILLIGDSCTDEYVYGTCERLNPEAPVPILKFNRKETTRGMAWNVRENLMSFGLSVYILTNKEQITKTRYIDEKSNQHILRVDYEGECEPMEYQQPFHERSTTDPPSDDWYDALVISDYDKGFLTSKKIQELVDWFEGPVFIDSKKTKLPKEKCYLKINESESKLLTGRYKNLIITKGAGGADYNKVNYPGEKTKIVDVVGAGDTFLSALVYFYLICGTIEKAIPYANKAAAIAVQNFGTYVLTENDVKDLCD
jgi:D-beta-D-heptose 7-phosphate kinase/D-beta-D-heptose 1-phosphate adenosyltransferase